MSSNFLHKNPKTKKPNKGVVSALCYTMIQGYQKTKKKPSRACISFFFIYLCNNSKSKNMKNVFLILFSGLFGVFGIENSNKITDVAMPLVASNYAPSTDAVYSEKPVLLAEKEQSQDAQNISITPTDIDNTKSVLEIVLQVVISIASLLGIFKNWKKKKPIEEIEIDNPKIINFKNL